MPELFPIEQILPETQDTTSGTVKFGRSWKFDFGVGDFVSSLTGKVAEAPDKDAWVEWCKKSIQTDRYRYLVYDRSYGQEFEDLIALHLTREANESEIKRMVTECLKVNPRTKSVDSFSFTWDGDKCYFTCYVYSVRDDTAQIGGEVII